MANIAIQKPEYKEILVDRKSVQPKFFFERLDSEYTWDVGREIPAIALEGEGGRYVLTGKQYARFLTYLGIGKRKFHDMMFHKVIHTRYSGAKYYKKLYIGSDQAQKTLEKLYANLSEHLQKWKILLVDGKVERITTETYIGVPHSVVQEAIEKRLNAEGVVFEKSERFGGINGIYTMTNVTGDDKSEVASQISYLNRNNGEKSLKIFGGAVVLVCKNGMTSDRHTSEMRIVHKMSMDDISRIVDREVGKLLQEKTIIEKHFLKLREYTITEPEAKKLVFGLPIPKYLQTAIWERLFQESEKTRNGKMDWDGTMWGIYMASTHIASHTTEFQKSKNRLKKTDENICEQLSKYELFSNAWDKREKELEQTEAQKMEVKK